MDLSWVTWTNPVAIWWIFLVSVGVCNILVWFFTSQYFRRKTDGGYDPFTRLMVYLSGAYVFGCAFRSFFPRADVQRFVLFDTWISSVALGRSVATVAELCFIFQWAFVLNRVANLVGSRKIIFLSCVIPTLICIAECFSWYGVITTHYLGNTIEESLWATSYILVALCLIGLWPKFKGALKYATGISFVGCLFYTLFMVTVDVPMYFGRLQADIQNQKHLLGFFEGLHDLSTRWVVSHSIADWQTEIPWMSLYFSIAVWTSLALCYVPDTREQLARHLKDS